VKLTRITITGADDGVSLIDLYNLATEFPFLEFGILYSHDRLGTPRYPSNAWRQNLIAFDDRRFSLHLCGLAAREAMAGIFTNLPRVPAGWRIQLNGFSKWKLPGLAIAVGRDPHEIILQCQSFSAAHEAERLFIQHPNVSILWDASGGRGIDDGWSDIPYPTSADGPRYGWAGGITVDNIQSKIELVLAANDLPALRNAECWLDLESGARTEDRFDMVKARRLLELAKPFVTATGAT